MRQDWKYIEFEKCIEKVPKQKQLQTSEYDGGTKFPIISQEDSLISGYCDDESYLYKIKRPIVIFGDHTRVLKYIDFDFAVGADGVKILLPIESLNAKFLMYYLKWYNIPSLGYSRHYKLLKEILVPCPSMQTQQSIVSELDLINELIAKKKAQLKDLDSLAQALFYEMFGDPISNDKGWPTATMNDIAPAKSFSGEIQKHNDKVWLLNLDMVESNTGKVLDKLYVDENEVGNSTATFNEDYVLYSKLRPYLNKVVLPTNSGYCTSELVPLLPDKSSVNRVYLAHLLRSSQFVNYINIKVAGAKMPRVSMSDFRKFEVIIPEIDLQETFASQISIIEKQKLAIESSLQDLETLLASRMQYYFD